MKLTFSIDTAIQVFALATEPMIEVDRVAVAETRPNLFQMMKNAGRTSALQTSAALGDRSRIPLVAKGG